MNAILTRLEYVERELGRLQAEVEELRALASSMVEPEPELAPEPAPAPVVVSAPPPAPPARPSRPPIELADLMNARTLAAAGGVVTLLGVVLLFVLAVNRGWIGPVERVAFGSVASAAAVALGFWVRSRYGQYHSALAAAGAGIGGGYTTLLAAVVLYELVPLPGALALAAAIAAVAVAVALLWSSQLIAALGLVGATLAPAAVALDSGLTTPGVGFAAFVFAGTAVVSVWQGWRVLLAAGLAASLPQAAALALSEPAAAAGALAVTLAFAALYLAAGLALQLRREPFDRLAAALVLLSATLSFASSAALLDGTSRNEALLSIAGVYSALAALVFRRHRDLAAVVAVAALTLGAIALATVLDGPALVAVWAAEAVGLSWLSGRVGDRRYAIGGLAYLGLAAGHALGLDAPPVRLYLEHENPGAGVPALVAVVLAATLVGVALRAWQARLAQALWWAAGVVAAYAAALGLLELVGPFDWAHVGVVALWAVAGAALLLAGSRLGRRPLLAGGAAWLAVVTLHLLFFDLAVLSEPERGWAALALAVPALAAGYLAELTDPRTPARAVFVPFGAAVTAIAVADLLPSGDPLGFALLGTAGAFGALTLPAFARSRLLATQTWTIALAFGFAASVVLLEGTALVAAWALAAASLARLAQRLGEARFQVGAVAFLAAGVAYALATVASPDHFFQAVSGPAGGVPALVLVAAAAAALALPARLVREDRFDAWLDREQRRLRTSAAWTAALSAFYALSLAVLGLVAWIGGADLHTEFQRGHTAVSAVWGAIGLVVLTLGLRRRWRAFQAAGFALFAVSLGKIFLFDLSRLSSIARAVSFLAVGALLLVAGFLYQRLSAAQDSGTASRSAG